MAVQKLTYQLLSEFETSLRLNQVIFPEHMEKLGCLQLRWWSWLPRSAEPDRFLVPLTWSILDACFRETWSSVPGHRFSLPTSKRALTLQTAPIMQVIQWDWSWEGLCSEHISQPQHLSSGRYRWETPSHSLCSAHGVTVSLSASSSYPASECQCWDATEMVIMFAPEPSPTPLADCLSLHVGAGQIATLQGHHCCPAALRLCEARLMPGRQLSGGTHGLGRGAYFIHWSTNALAMEMVF